MRDEGEGARSSEFLGLQLLAGQMIFLLEHANSRPFCQALSAEATCWWSE